MNKEPRKIPLSDFISKRKEPKRIPLRTEKSLEHENLEKDREEGLCELESQSSH